MDSEWNWFEGIDLDHHDNALQSPIPSLGISPSMLDLNASSNSLPDSSTTQEYSAQPDDPLPEDLRFMAAPQLGVFDSPLDPSGFWNLDEQVDSYPSLSSAEQSRGASPGLEAIRDRTRHSIQSPRGLPRNRSRYSTRRSGNPSTPVYISPSPSTPIDRDPMQRWQDSPPEDEPADLSAIMNALQTTPNQKSRALSRSNVGDIRQPADAFRGYRQVASSNSGESSRSKSSQNSIHSENSGTSGSSLNSSASRSRKFRGRVKKSRSAKLGTDQNRSFCCTFCCDRFKSKYDWTRHEKSLHLNLEAWVCAPYGGAAFSMTTRRRHCAYCHVLEPDTDHLKQHHHQACHGDSTEPRVFRRKDHLVQHLRLVHELDVMPMVDDWKLETPDFTSRCGICDQKMNSWNERADHIAAHYKEGRSMVDWHGEHDFPPHIAVQITNALPPYLIGSESRSIVPFSATGSGSRDHFFQISSNAGMEHRVDNSQPVQSLPENFSSQSELSSFTEILTMHLSRYAQEQMKQGIIPTDDMFQQESRRLLYDCEDNWNQTVADNGQWLSAFRRLHCQPEDVPVLEKEVELSASGITEK
ncbi:uncharacterized protein N7511_007374 [Penicillium nucicola]|uniref:uncharacterized protein n=1 Tax=Penicillium nucicola TaxID=1850975 RepID=UPI002545564D|nr:uncharacterized protein N7511_007374 [Penicillium nucicola]KAJ5757192.1 hypothetical protein N7511_007374 [Penicillium nucicola]